jgi:hypothetical protein
MFEKIGRSAEKAATNVSLSRRGLFGRLGQAALASAGVLGGLLVFPKDALAGGSFVCCTWDCTRPRGQPVKIKQCFPPGTKCSPYNPCSYGGPGSGFVGQTSVQSCTSCR